MLTAEFDTTALQRHFIKGSESFRLEYDPHVSERVLQNDIVSYLGEYRFQVQKYNYSLFYTHGTDGLHIRGQEDGEALLAIGKRGIEDRHNRGETMKKVVADYMGMQKMEEQLANAQDGDTILYASPADTEEGYAYGFFYIGHVVSLSGGEKRLEMTAIRLDKKQQLERYNKVIEFLVGQNPQLSTVNEFIANPQLVRKTIGQLETDFVLRGVFGFVMDQNKQKRFVAIMEQMQPQIREFIGLVRSGISTHLLEPAFNALENYSLELLQQYQEQSRDTSTLRRVVPVYKEALRIVPNLGMLIQTHGFEPPKVTGSCGSSVKNNKGGLGGDLYGLGSLFGNEIVKDFSVDMFDAAEEEDEYGSLTFKCPHCGTKNKRTRGELIEDCQNSSCGKSVRC